MSNTKMLFQCLSILYIQNAICHTIKLVTLLIICPSGLVNPIKQPSSTKKKYYMIQFSSYCCIRKNYNPDLLA